MRHALLSLAALSLLTDTGLAQNPSDTTQNRRETASMDARVDDLVGRMTLEEKVTEMTNSSKAIPRLGIPAYDWWNEGLHGVARSGYATMFPQAIGMASTWDAPLLGEIGDVISTEARAKYNEAVRHNIHSIYYGLSIWSPNINIFRDPRWGRGQETYGEDPYLTSRLGVSFVRGLQGTDPQFYKVIATPKHFAVHSGPESTRHSANVEPSPHDLWDTYLPAFRATITEAKADSIMCAYNAIDGQPACGNKQLLVDILRGDWAFKGFVTSDCGAVDDFFEAKAHHTSKDRASAAADALHAGTDTNCGDTYSALGDAMKQHLVSEAEIDGSLKRLFKARFELGMFDPPAATAYNAIPFSEVGSPAHGAIALQAARESIVLLKNSTQTLPLKKVATIAVVGPNAASLSALEGNYNAIPRDPVMPVDGIARVFPGAHVIYAQGAPYAEGANLPVPRTVLHPASGSAVEGLKAEYFPAANFNGKPVATRIDPEIDFDWNSAAPAPGTDAAAFAVRWTGVLAMPAAGDYTFSGRLAHCYPCGDSEQVKIVYDGKEVTAVNIPASEFRASTTPQFVLHVSDTAPHSLRVEYVHHAPLFGGGLTLEYLPKAEILRKEAVEAAKQADVVVAYVGLSPELEGEEMPVKIQGFAGGDRTDIALPAAQLEMLEAVKQTGKPLVVVLMNGSALAVPWAKENADAILEAWYPGQAGAQAIAETLSGMNNPGGRLPVTFYKGTEQLPPFDDYSMSRRTYRYFSGEPLYGFGFGLSYTTFAYSHVKLSSPELKAGETLTVEADVRNAGTREGDEVAELYLVPPASPVAAHRVLSGFERVHLKAGEQKHLSFTLDPRTLSQVDAEGKRRVMPGSYRISLGGTQPDATSKLEDFSIAGSLEMPH